MLVEHPLYRLMTFSFGPLALSESIKETLKKTSRFWQNTRIPPAEFPHEADDLR